MKALRKSRPLRKPDAGNPHVRFDEGEGAVPCAPPFSTLLSSMVLLLLERARAWAWIAAAALLALVLLSTDYLQEHHTGWAFLDAYLTKNNGSLFPLFPWLGFALVGFLCAKLPLNRRALLLGAALVFGMKFIDHQSTTLFFFERVGWVILFATIISWAWTWLEHSRPALKSHLILLAGRESLTAYVVHLLLLYTVPIGNGRTIATVFGLSQSWLAVFGWFWLALSVTLAFLLCKQRLSKKMSAS
jgi:hypothetical protein